MEKGNDISFQRYSHDHYFQNLKSSSRSPPSKHRIKEEAIQNYGLRAPMSNFNVMKPMSKNKSTSGIGRYGQQYYQHQSNE
jgi:hypothetical protein